MTDIVNRLRKYERPWPALMDEAADEIERLKAEAVQSVAKKIEAAIEQAYEMDRLKGEVKELTVSYDRWQREMQEVVEEERKRCVNAVELALSMNSCHDVARVLAVEAIERQG